MYVLTDSLICEMQKQKETILQQLQNKGQFRFSMQLDDEPENLLEIVKMPRKEIEKYIAEAIESVFPGRVATNVFNVSTHISFNIK